MSPAEAGGLPPERSVVPFLTVAARSVALDMRVIFEDISRGRLAWMSLRVGGVCLLWICACRIRRRALVSSGFDSVALLDNYLEFVAARCRPNMVLAVAFDLKVFFTVVNKLPAAVTSSDVLAFISSQRAGGEGRSIRAIDEESALSSRTVPPALDGLRVVLVSVGAR
jgi:hypothetical protein